MDEPVCQSSPSLPADANVNTVRAILENLRVLVAYEEQRIGSLAARGAGLAGFAGLATAVIAAGTDDVLPLASKVLLAAAVAGLVLAAAGIVLGVMVTRDGKAESLTQVATYKGAATQRLPTAQFEAGIVEALFERLEALRKANARRATWLDGSARVLAFSVLFAAAAAVVRFFA